MAKITTYDWRDKRVVILIMGDDTICFKNQISKEGELQEGIVVILSKKDFLSGLNFLTNVKTNNTR